MLCASTSTACARLGTSAAGLARIGPSAGIVCSFAPAGATARWPAQAAPPSSLGRSSILLQDFVPPVPPPPPRFVQHAGAGRCQLDPHHAVVFRLCAPRSRDVRGRSLVACGRHGLRSILVGGVHSAARAGSAPLRSPTFATSTGGSARITQLERKASPFRSASRSDGLIRYVTLRSSDRFSSRPSGRRRPSARRRRRTRQTVSRTSKSSGGTPPATPRKVILPRPPTVPRPAPAVLPLAHKRLRPVLRRPAKVAGTMITWSASSPLKLRCKAVARRSPSPTSSFSRTQAARSTRKNT